MGCVNAAILSLGSIIVMYTLVVSTMNTAHEGEVLGRRWSSIWIPLRMVFGVGMLLPKATGYSFVQVFVMWLVVQGVGAADSVWSVALDYFQQGGNIIRYNAESGWDNTSSINVKESMASLFHSMVCVHALQKAADAEYERNIAQGGSPTPPPILLVR